MGEIVISIVAKLAEYTVVPILYHARYLCCFNKISGNLSNAKEKLKFTRNSVKKQVEEAIKRTEIIEPAVEKWLTDVEKVLEEVHMLEGKLSDVSKSYFRWRSQYFLTKKIARTIEKMTQLQYSRLEQISSKSPKWAFNEILKELRNKSFIMIGLHGLGGSGKTTFVKEVGKKAEELKLFEKVVMATVSQTPNIRSIQGQIADKLGLEFKEESEEGRAQRLSKRLSEGKILLILDDVWEKLNFEAIGIPFNENNKGCGVLLTTREREVCTSMQCQRIIELNLLTYKEAWDLFQFYAKITDNSSAALKDVARKIVKECKGLPIALVTLGSTLRGKTLEEWELALSRLEDSKPLDLDIPIGLTSPHACLKLSYDNLTSQLAKSLLLLCSIFPEDHEIDLEDLFRFGRGLGLIGTSGTLDKSRREMHVAINILRDSCLLLHAKNKEKVKMHDVVRDVALWIASERDQEILAGAAMDPTILVQGDNIKDKNAISLWDWENGQLPDDPLNCPTLEILLLHSPNVGFEVSNACLERFKMLKILAILRHDYQYYPLRGNATLSLPRSIESLQNLHTLCLRGYKLGDISILESLQALEILDLRGSSFKELPNGIASLKKLKLLDLFDCFIQEKNAYEVIGRCLQLNELCLYINSYAYQKCPHNISFSRLERYVLIFEMDRHVRFDMLEEHRPTRALCTDGFNASVQSFMSLPIKDFFQKADYLHLMNLMGGYKNVIPSMDPQGMNQLIFLDLQSCPEIECLFDSSNVDLLQTEDAFSSLVILRLYTLDNLEEVFHDPSSRCSLKNLEELNIGNCRQLYNIAFPKNSKLCHLKLLRIGNCPMLTSIFKPSIVQTLELLEEVEISDCYELKQIIEEVEEGTVDHVGSQSHTSLMLPKLRTLTISGCNSLKYIFPMCFAARRESLVKLDIEECRELKYVFGSEKEHHDLLYQSHRQINIHINMLNLDTIRLNRLPNLVDIWPKTVCPILLDIWLGYRMSVYQHQSHSQTNIHIRKYFPPHLPSLKELRCTDCPRLHVDSSVRRVLIIDSDPQQDSTETGKEVLCLVTTTFNQLSNQVLKFRKLELSGVGVLKGIFQFQIIEHGSNTELAPLNLDLTHAELRDLPKLEFIWNGPTNFLSLQMLDRIDVNGCPKLKTIFSPTIVRSLPMLNMLSIANCEELEQVFDSDDAQSLYTSSQQVCFPNLDYIWVRKCNKLKYLFHNFVAGDFHKLTNLKIEDCSKLQKVFERKTGDNGQEGIVKDGEKVLLHHLQYITLSSLPNFKEIHHGFKLKDHVYHDISDCPKYSTSLYLHTE